MLMKKIFLNENFILSVIFVNAAVIFLQESRLFHPALAVLDILCSLVFIIEMGVKHSVFGVRGYWRDGWNRMDGVLVILSIPSIVMYFCPFGMFDTSVLLVMRLFRVLRVFRMMHFFPGFSAVIDGFKLAMRKSYAVLLSFFVIIVIFGLINCSLFGIYAPEYFGTPLSSIFSVFRLCTIEGWYEIPDAIQAATSPFVGHLVSIYFSLLLIMGGIIGMSFINSIFVDAMVEDNNDDVKSQLSQMERKIDELQDLVRKLQK